ncbi:unnamed protein product, partial [Didymodactylos carnosus]
QCILPQTTPETILSNPWYGKGFYEPQQYKVAIERCKNGYDSCESFIKLLEHRVKIERDYSTELKKWSLTWLKEIQHSQDYGTNKKTCLALINTGEQQAYSHVKMADNLQENVINKMLLYRRENYSRSLIHLQKMMLKKLYLDSSKKLKSYEQAEKIIQSDSGKTDEQKQHVKLTVDTLKKDCSSQKVKYQQLIEEMKNMRPQYEISMNDVLERTNDFERKRMNHFKQIFQDYHDTIYTPNDENLAKMSTDFKKVLSEHNVENDIQWWNTHYGKYTESNWPVFEELKD